MSKILFAMIPITISAFNHGLLRTSTSSLRLISSTKKIFNLHKPVISSVYKEPYIQRQHHQITTIPLNLLPSRYFSTTDDISKSIHLHAKDDDEDTYFMPDFKRGDKVMVEVIYFGPLGASVDVVAHNSHDNKDCIGPKEPSLGRGMILQREIDYFRKSRDMVDVVKYEILPAYVENISEKEYDGGVETRLDISLRPPGGKAKAQELGEQILERLKEDGTIDIGDKSSPEEINEKFPGSSKSAFKKAVSGLYRQGLVKPGPFSITLM